MIRIQIQPCPPVERGDGRDPGAPAARPLLDTPVDSLLAFAALSRMLRRIPFGAAPAVVFPAMAALAVHGLCDACQVAVVDSTTGTTHHHRFRRNVTALQARRQLDTIAARTGLRLTEIASVIAAEQGV